MAEGELQRVVGTNLLRIRREMKLSQERLANDVLGLSTRYVAGIEAGRHNMTLRSVERLAEALGVDPIELLK
ncbi:helix-turn-helix transcriptional regulator [Nocardia speluncae]|uniref:Helix-turn-helix transcriptional regulator n=1 Tax=Nocardia speluncae TaxID=419477 RepID=A0A846XKS6_9NOCA|nr:helix-turn-helix transcriptional regulator [Nocardia speluncae]NKY35240.1 helix-turn-helix transcriptional regulator [Nocardia speluncae]